MLRCAREAPRAARRNRSPPWAHRSSARRQMLRHFDPYLLLRAPRFVEPAIPRAHTLEEVPRIAVAGFVRGAKLAHRGDGIEQQLVGHGGEYVTNGIFRHARGSPRVGITEVASRLEPHLRANDR